MRRHSSARTARNRRAFTPIWTRRANASAMRHITMSDHMDTRGDSIRVVHPLFPTEGGGSIPTSPLQFHIGKIERKVFAKLNHAWHSRLPNVGNCTIGICYGAE